MSDDHLLDFERAGRITASVVGAILRLDPSHSRKWAWRVITGREPDRPTFDTIRGNEHESDAIFGFECEHGILCECGRFVPHPTIEWLGASPDAIVCVADVRIPVEAKCPRIIHGDIPPKYNAQLQTQMQCLQAPYGWFVSWTEADGIWALQVERDDAWWETNFPILAEFYELYVKPDVEPPRAARRKKDV